MSKRLTLLDIANRAGVSPRTVSNVVNGYVPVSDKLRQRVEQKACTTDREARLRMADQQRDLVQSLPARPNERLVYQCEPAAAG